MSDKFIVGQSLTASENNGRYKPVSRVTLLLDDNNEITAGDDTGYEIVASCPHATQEMANAILARMKGYTYQAFSASDATIDPAFELGDGVTADGIYGMIGSVEDDGSGFPSLSAAGEADLEEEYPSEGPLTQQINRNIKSVRSEITKTSEEIRLLVTDEINNLSSSFSVQLDSITARVDGLDGNFTELKTTVDGVTITDSSGTTLIKGNAIYTPTLYVDAANITGMLQANQINLTGSITFGDLDSEVENQINEAYNLALDNQLPDYIKSTYIDSTRIESPEIYGGEIYALNGNGAYAKMDDDAFSLLYEGSSVPRAVLQVSNSEATLALGVGSGTAQNAGRFFVTKSAIGGGVAAILYITSDLSPIGIIFRDNGTIDFNATKTTGLYMEFE